MVKAYGVRSSIMVELTLDQIREGLQLSNMSRAAEVRRALVACGLAKDKWQTYKTAEGERVVRLMVIE